MGEMSDYYLESMSDFPDELFIKRGRELLIQIMDEPPSEPPSRDTSRYWHMAHSPTRFKEAPTRTGKWMLFEPDWRIDAVWDLIKEETEAGRLGISAKVATRKPNRHSQDNQKTRLVCVYTVDYNDLSDVMAVRKRLRDLGWTKKLYYKTDEATTSGKYGEKSWRYAD